MAIYIKEGEIIEGKKAAVVARRAEWKGLKEEPISEEFLFSNFIFEFSDLQFPTEGNFMFTFKIGDVENSLPLKVYFQK